MSYGSVVLADAPRHFWRCADPGGSLLHDIGSATQRALIPIGAITVPYSGIASEGGSCWFDGNVGAWHVGPITVKSPFSIEVWCWIHTFVAAAKTLAEHYANLQINPAGTVLFASGGPNITSPAAITEQAWHHIVGTYGPAGGAKLYIDALTVVVGAFGANWGPFNQIPALGMSGAGGAFCSANLAEFATYDVELTPAQVTNHFLAADTAASRPVFKTAGTWSSTTGGVTTVTDLASDTRGFVSRTYQNSI